MDLHVPAVQLARHAEVSKRLNTALYSLMFARKLDNVRGSLIVIKERFHLVRVVTSFKTRY